MSQRIAVLLLLAPLLFAAPAAAAPGDLDPGFAHGGVYRAPFQTEPPTHDEQTAAVDAQGRVVVAATVVDDQGHKHLDVLRLTPQGEPDATFANGGRL
jgi:hypothetical protein